MTLIAPSRAAKPADSGLTLAPERLEHRACADAVIERAFGPGRYAKAAERLRENNRPRLDLSRCAWAGRALVGTVRLWPVRIGFTPALFLGPIAVEAAWRQHGVGGRLVRDVCESAQAAGEALVLLVGDTPFFGPLGFDTVPLGRVVLPGPVDPSRVLWRALRPGALDEVSGPASAAR